jgi:hypothetical protein
MSNFHIHRSRDESRAEEDRAAYLRGCVGQLTCLTADWEEDGRVFSVQVLMECGHAYVDLSNPLFAYLNDIQSPKTNAIIQELVADLFQAELEALEEKYAAMLAAQRADREAAKTRPRFAGHVYLFESESGSYKIGRTGNVQSRLALIQTSSPYPVKVVHSIHVDDMVTAEAFLHRKFAAYRRHGEWFDLTPLDVEWFKSLGPDFYNV